MVGRPPFNIGFSSANDPETELTLESDAQPPIPQSDLLSYLAFGRSSSSLLQVEGSGLSGVSATGDLIGVGAALAMKRMAALALGIMADEVEGEATRGLGADVFNIMPAEISELGGADVINFFQEPGLKLGSISNPYLFVAVQASSAPGAGSVQDAEGVAL